MDELRIRFYDVLFGDAILITVPDKDGKKTTKRRILIDVGNVLSRSKEGAIIGDDEVFKPVIEDVMKELDGDPLDLYIMTHEHLDHVQGLFYCSAKESLDLKVNYAWLTASAEEGYYDTFTEAKKEKDKFALMFNSIENYFQLSAAGKTDKIKALLANNNPRSTEQCIDYLRKLAKKATSYVHRGSKPKHPFKEVKFEILAPEQDTSEYYGRFQAINLGISETVADGQAAGLVEITQLVPPSGVDAGAFFDLVESRRNGSLDNLLTIDKAANNTSVVFSMEWRGYRLLFCGDAEQRSWKTILKNAPEKLKPTHLLKVSHHGSSNGMPVAGVLEKLFPDPAPDKKERFAAISTCLGAYNGVPHDDTMNELAKYCTIKSTKDLGKFDIVFKG